jgi:hypothetical protein
MGESSASNLLISFASFAVELALVVPGVAVKTS